MANPDDEAASASWIMQGAGSVFSPLYADDLSARISQSMTVPSFDFIRAASVPGAVFAAQAAAITSSIQETFAPFRQFLADLEAEKVQAEALQSCGILPHYTTPWQLYDATLDADAIRDIIVAYYRDRWEEVSKSIMDRMRLYGLDQEATEVMQEALGTHLQGFFRSTVRLVFPELERVAGKYFYKGDIGKGITSLPLLRKALLDLPADDYFSFDYGLSLYNKIDKHLYRKVKTPEAVEAVTIDMVPNRHAALHGIVPYSQEVNSLNAIIMADCMFHFISCMNIHLHEQSQPERDEST